eukprot:5026-Heterococcus_DN1.PRE.1
MQTGHTSRLRRCLPSSPAASSYVVIAFTVLLGDTARGILWPTLYPLVTELGGSSLTLGGAVAAFSVGRVAGSPILGACSHAAVVPGPLCSWCGDVRTGRRFSPYNHCCTAGDGARHLKSWCVSWLCSRQLPGVRENTETCSAHSPPASDTLFARHGSLLTDNVPPPCTIALCQ